MKNVLKPLAKSVLLALGLTAETSVANTAIQKKKKKIGSGTTKLIISNKDMENNMKILKGE